MFLKLLYDDFMTAYVTVFVLQIMYCCILGEIKYVALCGRRHSQYGFSRPNATFCKRRNTSFLGRGKWTVYHYAPLYPR